MCRFCEKDEKITEGDKVEISIDYQSDLEVKVSAESGDHYAYFKIGYCPMCGQRI